MTLATQQRAFTRVCFAEEPARHDLDALGAKEQQWLLYRRLVRNRLAQMIESGLPRTIAALGRDRFGQAYARWLANSPPSTRYIRDIIPAFEQHLRTTEPPEPAWLHELAAYEATRWAVGYVDVGVEPAGELTFEKRAVVNPTVRLLAVEHRVHKRPSTDADAPVSYERNPATLCIVRKRDDRVATLVLTERSAGWLQALRDSNTTITDTVTKHVEERGETIDEAYVTALGSTLAAFLENDVLLGAEELGAQ